MSLGDHLEELRRRIIYALIGLVVGVAAALCFAPYVIAALKRPYVAVMQRYPDLKPDLTALALTTAFTMYMKVALYAGLVVASPWVFYQLWMFVSAGLYSKEKRYVVLAVPFSAALFVGGAVFFLAIVSEPVLHFLIGLSIWLDLVPMITFENYIHFMTGMMVVFGLCFQTPLVILLLGAIGVVTTKTLNRYRRHVIVAIFILAAVFTSPSPVDQIAMAIPMWLLYELGVLLLYLLSRKKKQHAEDTRAG